MFVRSGRVTMQNVALIELAYKSISFEDLHKLFGLNAKLVQQICNERGWQIDAGGVFVLPKRNGSSLPLVLRLLDEDSLSV